MRLLARGRAAPEETRAYERTLDFERRHHHLGSSSIVGGSPWAVPQRAFFVPLSIVDEAWEWTVREENRGFCDVLLHPNSGCMHDDHGLRGTWILGPASKSDPTISTLGFPCNMPATGCNDNNYEGPPSCGCDTPLDSDAPDDSCKNCVVNYAPSSSLLE